MARTRPPALRDGDLASAVGGLRADMRGAVRARGGRRAGPTRRTRCRSPRPSPSTASSRRRCSTSSSTPTSTTPASPWSSSEDAVLATVRDEGPGFDPSAVRPDRGRHVGLGLLRERARLSGGGARGGERPGRRHPAAAAPAARSRRSPRPRRGLPPQRAARACASSAAARRPRAAAARRCMHSRSHQARRCTPRSRSPSVSGSGVHDARTSTSLASSASSTCPKRTDTVRVTVPPAAVCARRAVGERLGQPGPADLRQRRVGAPSRPRRRPTRRRRRGCRRASPSWPSGSCSTTKRPLATWSSSRPTSAETATAYGARRLGAGTS